MGTGERFFLALAWLSKAAAQAALATLGARPGEEEENPELISYAETVSFSN
jgi:hypothetical protein